MSGEIHRLWCLIDNDYCPFQVVVGDETNADELKDQIKRKSTLHDIRISGLALWKLIEPEPVEPEDTLAQRIMLRGDVAMFATKLTATQEILTLFPKRPLKNHVHILVKLLPTSLHTWKHSPGERPTDERNPKRLRSLTGATLGSLPSEMMAGEMAELHKQIQLIPDKPEDYSDPSRVIDLPFPSTNVIPACFAISKPGKRSISYMGREFFMEVWRTFLQVKGDSCHRQAIYLYGGKGFGKSHLLAALACLLIHHGHRVVYLPNCREMLLNPLDYLKTALLFAFVGTEMSIKISQCTAPESLADFCQDYRSVGQLCFVVDQLNALDPELSGEDRITDDRKSLLSQLLQRMSARHIEITNASANHKSAKHLAMRDTGDRRIPLMKGMTMSEMSCWWQRHDAHFKAFSTEDKQKIEDLTGRIPLLLNPFLMHSGKPLETLEPLIWDDEVLASVGRETIDFAKKQKSNLSRETFHDEFIPLMRNCLTGNFIAGSGMLIDHRYFYLDSSNRGHYSCGLARQAITRFLREHGEERIFLGEEWLKALEYYKDNPSVIGFVVEQVVISKIASCGVHSGNFKIPGAKIKTFDGDTPMLSRDRRLTYYVPLKFNLRAIDALFVSLDQKKSTAHVVAIQITVARWHNDSEASFFKDLDMWLSGLKGFTITISFLWIHEGERGRIEVEEKLTKLRNGTVSWWPQHDVHWVSIEQVDVDLANALARIRPDADHGAGRFLPASSSRPLQDEQDSGINQQFDTKSSSNRKKQASTRRTRPRKASKGKNKA